MAFSNSIKDCTRIIGYSQAVRHFEDTKRPRSVRWDADERPLYKTSTHHYRLKRGPDGEYYDVVLYNTTMLRYMKPEANGVELVYLHYDDRRASREFFWRQFGAGYGNMKPFDVGLRYIPVSWDDQRELEINGITIPVDFYAVLARNPADKRYIRHLSAHRPVYAKVSSDEDKEDRAKLRKGLEWVIDMMVLRIGTFHEAADVSLDRGRAFGGAQKPWNHKMLTHVYPHRLEEQFAAPEELARLEALAQEVYNVALSKRAYAENDRRAYTLNKSDRPIEVAVFRKALTDKLISLAGLNQQTGKEWLPLFPESLPNRYFAGGV